MKSNDQKHAPATGIHCPHCQAMNASSRLVCDLCGTRLISSVVEKGMPRSGCLNCGTPLKEGTEVCPKCGRLQNTSPPPILHSPPYDSAPSHSLPSALDNALRAVPPNHYAIEPLANGQVRLRRSAWGRLNGDASWLLIALFVGMSSLRFLSYSGRFEGGPPSFLVFVPFTVIVLIGIIWAFFLQEDLYVGRAFLERRYSLFGRSWSKVIEGSAVLRIETQEHGPWSRYGARTVRTLIAQNLGQRIPLGQQTRHLSGGIFGVSDNLMSEDEPSKLADFLAAQTGWQVIDSRRGRI